jgi:Protein of unknown function (DUF3667)
VRPARRGPGPPVDTAQPTELRGAACLNCGVPLTGRFCAACGQRDVPPYPMLRELAADAFARLSGWDGQFIISVRALVQRPGLLTREFLEGRRARYISPLRLYLMASVVYFVVAAASPNIGPQSGTKLSVGPGVSVDVSLGTSGSDKTAVLEEIARAPAVVRPLMRRAVEDPAGLKRRILETVPRVFFALLPVFAAIVALFYRGRRYAEHLYFAIHLQAFIFLALAVPELLKFTRSTAAADAAGLAAAIWIPVYAARALREVYGGRLGRTLIKELGIAAIYGLTSLVGFISALYWISIVA